MQIDFINVPWEQFGGCQKEGATDRYINKIKGIYDSAMTIVKSTSLSLNLGISSYYWTIFKIGYKPQIILPCYVLFSHDVILVHDKKQVSNTKP